MYDVKPNRALVEYRLTKWAEARTAFVIRQATGYPTLMAAIGGVPGVLSRALREAEEAKAVMGYSPKNRLAVLVHDYLVRFDGCEESDDEDERQHYGFILGRLRAMETALAEGKVEEAFALLRTPAPPGGPTMPYEFEPDGPYWVDINNNELTN